MQFDPAVMPSASVYKLLIGCVVPRPIAWVSTVAADGVLIYETFAAGNERFGKPSNPDFLLQPGELLERVLAAADAAYEAKVALVGAEQFGGFARMVLLQSVDTHWREHLAALDYLRQGIHLRGYAQKNPKQEYKREAFELFGRLLDVVKADVARVLLTVRIQSREEAEQAAQALEQQGESFANVTYTHPNEDGSVATETDPDTIRQQVPRVGRNDPCPCGSGQKYKNCHGKIA